ncbi:MAG: DUF2157 domain-containing protein [Terracidiphilus sp.]
MADFDSHLKRWQAAGVLDEAAAERIRAFEQTREKPAWPRWQGMVALILGAILLVCGVVLFVSARWDWLSPWEQFLVLAGLVGVFHVAAAYLRPHFPGLSAGLAAAGTIAAGVAILTTGQIFHLSGHGAGALLLCPLAALAGWALLGDQAQQTLTLLLFPIWLMAEISEAAFGHFGGAVFVGRFLAVWCILFLTFFLESKKKLVQGVLFAVGAVGGVGATALMLVGWQALPHQTAIGLGARTWIWVAIVVVPLTIGLIHPRRCFVPLLAAVVYGALLPWTTQTWRVAFDNGLSRGAYTQSEPSLLAHALVAAFAVFFTWWGVRMASRALVNLGVVWFALAVGWFFYSDLFDKVGRSLGLIALGLFFLVGGWALERTRRGLLSRIEPVEAVAEAGVQADKEEGA